MSDASVVIEPSEAKADAVSGLLVRARELGRPHVRNRLWLENAPMWPAPTGEQRAEEATEVGDRGVHAAGGRHAERKGGRGEAPSIHRPHRCDGKAASELGAGLEAALRHA